MKIQQNQSPFLKTTFVAVVSSLGARVLMCIDREVSEAIKIVAAPERMDGKDAYARRTARVGGKTRTSASGTSSKEYKEWREHETHEHVYKPLIEFLKHAVQNKKFEELILIAPKEETGHIKKRVPALLENKLVRVISKNLYKSSLSEIIRAVRPVKK